MEGRQGSAAQGSTKGLSWIYEAVTTTSISSSLFDYDNSSALASEPNSTIGPVSGVANREANHTTSSVGVFESELIIPLYVVIFVLSVVGNSLVLVTLARNKRMRTVTNVYLLNLAVSDLLLGVFCMPFTLVGQVLRSFIFGAMMCRLIPYFQAVSVSVGVWTLVAISLERYFAICRPLKSRRWQTQFHAYKMIAIVWTASLLWTTPILIVSTLKSIKGRTGHKCREEWPSATSEQAYNLFLDAILLLVPLLIMSLAYSLIMSKLWKGLRREIKHNSSYQRQMHRSGSNATIASGPQGSGLSSADTSNLILPNVRHHRQKLDPSTPSKGGTEAIKLWLIKEMVQVRLPSAKGRFEENGRTTTTTLVTRCDSVTEPLSAASGEQPEVAPYAFTRHAIRSNHIDKSIEAKKKVIRMLFVIVAEFFICWAPIHILNTWYLFAPKLVYNYMGSTGVSLVQLLAYISSCCNPITYCFMNKKFRQAFIGVFDSYGLYCCYCCGEADGSRRNRLGHQMRKRHLTTTINNSDVSGNDSTVFVGRASVLNRSEVVVLEAEDRV